ncbi:MAG: type VI secretion system-associated FHA domain protein TagH [Gammaproteobacteria bacterium]|nr:type VI secretion system-associated FHA domain protein TagH [Gammaproteobacteria bacterium]MBT8110548.1 type VI secretion system-associated FHA domain protein TagH [Gammaproteobacteria bacterium]NND47496.1 type VI secretion system-associated FHA domain protein TagH [Woeseiaceae bacterium]NNL45248.1 type VI secretion system-associated FHA domain protein TagH [Woeseiaceae bacterium]
MALQLKIVSEHRDLVGNDAEREFREEGGTIGRSLENDWILPDPDRYISGRHATIDQKAGMYYLLDTSSNGVYVNDEVEPIGRGNPRRLFDGDRLRMGDFEFTVSLDSGESLAMPLDAEPSVAPDHVEQFVDEDLPKTGVKLLDEEEITGDDEFQSVLFGDSADMPSSRPIPKSGSKAVSKSKRKSGKAANDAKPAREKAAPLSVSAEDLFDSFLDGLGINRAELHPSVNRPELMLKAGNVLREFVDGIIKLLAARANLKNTFRLDQTTLLPQHNNPLKFSESRSDLIKQLLVGDEGDYLGAKDAVREVCNDLLNHQNAFLDAMNSAFIEFSERFEPDELQDGFDRALTGGKLFSFKNKAKYWDLYRDLYPIMTEKGGGRFPQMFGEEFVRAYERQVAEYQRHDRESLEVRKPVGDRSDAGEADLMVTQKLGPRTTPRKAPRKEEKVVDAVSETGADAIDQSFIEELDNSMAEEIDPRASARHKRPN